MADYIEDLEITALTHGGRGIGRHDGKAIFVPLTAPGDRISCKVVRDKKRFTEAELVHVKVPAPGRRDPPCPYFGECGGCQWQHLSYHEQILWKQQIFSDHLVRNEIADKDSIRPIVPAPDEWRYRNRVQFKCDSSADGFLIGFFKRGSHSVVDVETCLLLAPEIQETLDLLRVELPACPHPGSIQQVEVGLGDDESIRIILHVLPEDRDGLRQWLIDFSGRYRMNACLQSGRKDTLETVYGDPSLEIRVGQPDMALRYGPGGFVQVNSIQNRRMIDEMLAILDLRGHVNVLDLFCGMGNFSLPLARWVGKVTGVENHEQSIDYARRNAADNRIDNVEFFVEDAASAIAHYKPSDHDLVVLDPPRAGHVQVVREVLQLKPRQILYVSCDPATLARDLKTLVLGGYQVASSRPFDLFPQTWHIESMTLLRRL